MQPLTLKTWSAYFKYAPIVGILAVLENAFLGTFFLFVPFAFSIVCGLVILRCMNCELSVLNSRIAPHFRGTESLKECPNCGKKMVPGK